MCRSSAAVKLLAPESVNIRRTRVRVPPSAILFFFNIHTSEKLEIFFDHSIPVNGVDPCGIHRFPWVNAMSAAFTGTEWVNSGPSQLSKKNIDWFRKSWTLFNIHTSDKLEIFFGGRVFSDSQPRSQDAIFFTMAKALCTGQRHYNRIHYNYHIWSSLQNRVSDRASECFLAPRYTRFIAFTSKNEID